MNSLPLLAAYYYQPRALPNHYVYHPHNVTGASAVTTGTHLPSEVSTGIVIVGIILVLIYTYYFWRK